MTVTQLLLADFGSDFVLSIAEDFDVAIKIENGVITVSGTVAEVRAFLDCFPALDN